MKKILTIFVTAILLTLLATTVLACSPGCGHENMDTTYLYQTYTHRLEAEGFDFTTWYNESLDYFASRGAEDPHCQPIFEEDGSIISVEMFSSGTSSEIIYYPMMIDGLPCYQNEGGDLIYGVHNIVAHKLWDVNLKAHVLDQYKSNLLESKFYHTNDKMYVTVIDGLECYQTPEGQLYYDGKLLYNNVATLDRLDNNETIIYQNSGTAITLDTEFITVYHYGEIINTINIRTESNSKG